MRKSYHSIYQGIYMSPRLSNMPTSDITTKLSSLELLANVAESLAQKDLKEAPEETQGHQTQCMSHNAVAGCSNTKDRTISDFNVKVTSVSETGIVNAEKKQYQCNQCDRRFQLSCTLERHTRNVHTKREREKCPYCKKTFKNNRSLDEHKRTKHRDHKKQYECKQCNQVFQYILELRRHTNSIHLTKPYWECLDCKKTFKSKSALGEHKKREHGDCEKLYKCSQCNDTFVYLSRLQQHAISHTDKRDHECSVCHKTYVYISALNRHIATKHSNKEKPFICEECGSKFFFTNSLKKHKLTHSVKNPSETKSQECQICKKRLSCQSALTRHQKIVHNKDHLRCDRCNKTFASKKYLNHHKCECQ